MWLASSERRVEPPVDLVRAQPLYLDDLPPGGAPGDDGDSVASHSDRLRDQLLERAVGAAALGRGHDPGPPARAVATDELAPGGAR